MRNGFAILDLGMWNALPFLLTCGLVLLENAPLYLHQISAVAPMLALISVYYWAVYRPDLMPAPLLFLLGLGQDLVSGGVAGIHPVTFLVCYAIIDWRRKMFHGKSLVVLWGGFSLVAALAVFLQWLLAGVIHRVAPPVMPAVFIWLMSLAAFPLLAVLLLTVHRRLPTRG